MMVRDPEAHKKIWVEALGAQVVTAGALELLKLPGIFLVLGKAEPAEGSEGSSVDHFAFRAKDLGATKAKLAAAGVPGMAFSFRKMASAQAATKGRSLDHIGFEVKDLEAFCKKLEANGVTFDSPFRSAPAVGLKIAFIVDPAGTRIKLTEGLAGK